MGLPPRVSPRVMFWTGAVLLAVCLIVAVFLPPLYNIAPRPTASGNATVRAIQSIVSFLYTIAQFAGIGLVIGSCILRSLDVGQKQRAGGSGRHPVGLEFIDPPTGTQAHLCDRMRIRDPAWLNPAVTDRLWVVR